MRPSRIAGTIASGTSARASLLAAAVSSCVHSSSPFRCVAGALPSVPSGGPSPSLQSETEARELLQGEGWRLAGLRPALRHIWAKATGRWLAEMCARTQYLFPSATEHCCPPRRQLCCAFPKSQAGPQAGTWLKAMQRSGLHVRVASLVALLFFPTATAACRLQYGESTWTCWATMLRHAGWGLVPRRNIGLASVIRGLPSSLAVSAGTASSSQLRLDTTVVECDGRLWP